jgi:ribosomal protein S12
MENNQFNHDFSGISANKKDTSSEDKHQINKDLYGILGVNKDATPEEIKQVYRRRAMEEHPDTKRTDQEREDAKIKFQQINEAYEILSDPEKRAQYDQYQTVDNFTPKNYWRNASYSTYENDEEFEAFVEKFKEGTKTYYRDSTEHWEKLSRLVKGTQHYAFNSDGLPNKTAFILLDAEVEKFYQAHQKRKTSFLDEIDEYVNWDEARINEVPGGGMKYQSPPKKDWKERVGAFVTGVAAAAIGFTSFMPTHQTKTNCPYPTHTNSQDIVRQTTDINKTLTGLEINAQKAPSLEQLQKFGGVAIKEKTTTPPQTVKAVNKTFGTNFQGGKEVNNFISAETIKKYQELDAIRGVAPGTTQQEFDQVANSHPGEDVYQKGKQSYKQRLEDLQKQEKTPVSPQSRQEKSGGKTQGFQALLNKFSAVGQSIATTVSNGLQQLQEHSVAYLAQMRQTMRG